MILNITRSFILMMGCLLLGSLACVPATADVYTYVDADGNRVYTDHPPSGKHSKKVDIAPSNEMIQTQLTRKLSPVKAEEMPPIGHYDLLRILVPEPDAVVRSQEGSLIVTATSEPVLREGDVFQLLLDGNASGGPSRSPVFPLTNIDRGTHQVAVEIIDTWGRTVERTPSQPFHMVRISLDQKREAHPCVKGDWGVRPECPVSDKPADEDDTPQKPTPPPRPAQAVTVPLDGIKVVPTGGIKIVPTGGATVTPVGVTPITPPSGAK